LTAASDARRLVATVGVTIDWWEGDVEEERMGRRVELYGRGSVETWDASTNLAFVC